MKKILLAAALFAAVACGDKSNPAQNSEPGKEQEQEQEPQTQEPQTPDPVETPAFAKGADIGWASEMEKTVKFKKKDGTEAPLLDVLKDCGVNAIRLRVWVDPYKGYSGKDDVVAVAKKVQAAGMALMVDFHYSDFFADPSRQQIPAAWQADKSDIGKMIQHVSSHTAEVLQALKDENVTVNWIQIGNETRAGMLFGCGDLVYANKGAEFANYVKLSNAGYDAAKAIYPDALVMPHIDKAFDKNNNTWWFTNFKNQGGKFDALALSHYPQNSWKGSSQLSASDANAQAVDFIRYAVGQYNVPIIVSEVGVKTQASETEAASVLQSFMTEIKKVDGVTGVFYWEPEVDGQWKPAVYSDAAAIKKYTGKQETWNAYNMGAFLTGGRPSKVMDALCN